MKHYDVVAAVHHEYPDFSITMTAYLCTPQSDTFHLNEHVAYRWCGKEELDGLDWAAADVEIVKSVCCR